MTERFDPHDPHPVPGMPNSSWLTVNQLASIGSVVAAWSWMDLALESLLSTLVQSDDFLSQALTEDLGPDNRLKATKRLVRAWQQALLDPTERQIRLFEEVLELTKWIAANNGKRNQIAHWIWVRSDDEKMFGWKHHVVAAPDNARPNSEITKSSIIDFSKEIGIAAGRLAAVERVARDLPPWPHAKRVEIDLLGFDSLISPYIMRSVESQTERPSAGGEP